MSEWLLFNVQSDFLALQMYYEVLYDGDANCAVPDQHT